MGILKLDIKQALYFLNQLDPSDKARFTLASEAPFGGKDKNSKWLPGATFERSQMDLLNQYIIDRQNEGANVYYGVNRACSITKQIGYNGKANTDDIVAIRALAFDIDVLAPHDLVLNLINKKLDGELKPSMVIATGGGYHLIYLLKDKINITLCRPPKDNNEKERNEQIIYNRSNITELARAFEYMLRHKYFPEWKIDNMSNVDRVMRLPGTINFPKAEKLAKGQKQTLSRIICENDHRIDIQKLHDIVPKLSEERSQSAKKPFIPSKKTTWTGYLKAKACCEFIRDNGLADTNEWYTLNVMLPLIGAIHDENKHNSVTIQEAEELFMMAISGGERYNTIGRGNRYFMRQWHSHRPELARNGTKSLGGLIYFCKENGMQLPWANIIVWNESFEKQLRELVEEKQIVDNDIIRDFSGFD